jgi:DNA-binding GntR family transcriptional regulator
MSSFPKSRLKRPGTTAEVVFERLVEGILSGAFPHGAPLREAQLARDWKVSRTPMREAVRRAAEAGFVVLRPNQAPIVRPLTADDIRDLYGLRELLERRALELAWPRFDAAQIQVLEDLAAAARPGQSRHWPQRCLAFDLALHAAWMKRCGNLWLTADLEWLYQFLRIIQSWIGRDHQALANAYAEHLAVLNAIKRREKAAALDRLRRHIRNSAVAVAASLARQSTQPSS